MESFQSKVYLKAFESQQPILLLLFASHLSNFINLSMAPPAEQTERDEHCGNEPNEPHGQPLVMASVGWSQVTVCPRANPLARGSDAKEIQRNRSSHGRSLSILFTDLHHFASLWKSFNHQRSHQRAWRWKPKNWGYCQCTMSSLIREQAWFWILHAWVPDFTCLDF